MSSQSNIRQNFHDESERSINDNISMCIMLGYTYEQMAFYFNRDDVALKGFSKFFLHTSSWNLTCFAENLMKYVNKRGGRVTLQAIDKPTDKEWGSGLEAMCYALECEKKLNASFLQLRELAEKNGDSHLSHFIQEVFLENQVAWIRKIGRYITQLKRVGTGLGEYIFDKELFFKFHSFESTKAEVAKTRPTHGTRTVKEVTVSEVLPSLIKSVLKI